MSVEATELFELMENLIGDHSVPRNIRRAVEEAKEKVKKEVNSTNISAAIYLLDDISNDINMPSHTRTDIWSIISNLEALKEKVK